MGRGGYKTGARGGGDGGHVKFHPYKKGKVLAILKGEGGHKKFWGSFYAVA